MSEHTRDADAIKEDVKNKYAKISQQSQRKNASSCCGSTDCCETIEYSMFAEDYSRMEGYDQEADLGLGCGLPTEYAQIEEGNTVVDLGSGAGIDCFVARREVGESGWIIGVDMTREMIDKARQNTEKLGYDNVEFVQGDIEDLPLDDNITDIVVSNCVMNLVTDKQRAFSETYRILKSGGHFSISDIVTHGELPDALKKNAEMYAGCVAGALDKRNYLSIIEEAGFANIQIQKQQNIKLPDQLLDKYLSEDELLRFNNSDTGIFSITIYAEKP